MTPILMTLPETLCAFVVDTAVAATSAATQAVRTVDLIIIFLPVWILLVVVFPNPAVRGIVIGLTRTRR